MSKAHGSKAGMIAITALATVTLASAVGYWFYFGKSKPILTIPMSNRHKQVFCFGPDAGTLICAEKNLLNVWNVKTHQMETILDGHLVSISLVTSSSSGEAFASFDESGLGILWDAKTRKRSKSFTGEEWGGDEADGPRLITKPLEPIYKASMSPCGRRIATLSGSGVSLWDLESGKRISKIEEDTTYPYQMGLTFGSEFLAIGKDQTSTKVYD